HAGSGEPGAGWAAVAAGLWPPDPHPCEGCRACALACPAGAIIGRLWQPGLPREELVDARRCAEWMASHCQEVGGEICGLCISSCPQGQRRDEGGLGRRPGGQGGSSDGGRDGDPGQRGRAEAAGGDPGGALRA
ncbi:MAG: hypothetical protein K6T75_05545, partial [Acetobacteraceae bacterium]|nr:hypothetical protein [Acetobacteraceae bacterium]